MKHLRTYNIFENDNICSTCNGRGGEEDYTIGGELVFFECDDCNGTGTSKRQKINLDLSKFLKDFEKELIYFLKRHEVKHGTVIPNIERYSESYDDIEKIEIEVQIYNGSNLDKDFLKELENLYYDYKLNFDSFNRLYLYVYKIY